MGDGVWGIVRDEGWLGCEGEYELFALVGL